MEDRVLCDAAPEVALQAPASVKVGETVQITASFDNVSTTDTGYGPYIDLLIDKTGADGAGLATDDGLSFVSASYLGQGVTTTILTFDEFGRATHPYAKDAAGAPQIVDAATLGYEPGDQMIVIQLPYGSFAPSQPAADVTISLSMSNLADADAPLKISARGGFQYGNDALDNSATDPTIVGGLTNATVTPSVLTVTKNYLGPENETATGINFTRQYELVLDLAAGQTLTNVHLIDILAAAGADAHQFVSLNSVLVNGSPVSLGTGYSIASQPSTTAPGGTLDVVIPSVTGTSSTRDAVVTFSFYVPRFDSAAGQGNAAVLNPSTGDDNIISNQAYGYASWTPIDTRDPLTVVSDQTATPNSTTPDANSEHDLEAQSIAIQKTISNVIRNGSNLGPIANDQILPGDIVEFTLNFQISDYFAFQGLSITDLMSDGWHLDLSAVTPTLSINGNTYALPAAAFGSTRYTSVIDTDNIYGNGVGTGTTTLQFDVSAELAARAASITATTEAQIADKAYAAAGRLLGGGINPLTPNGTMANNLSGYNGGATTGQIVYRAVVLDKFTDAAPGASPNTSTESSLNPRDQLTNTATVQGTLIDLAAAAANPANTDASGSNNVLVSTGNTEADDTGLLVSVRQDTVQKQIYAINGIINGTPAFNAAFRTGGIATGSINLRAGDQVTYRIIYTIPTGDVERLRFTDYLPLPIYSVTDPDANGTPSGFTFQNNIVAGNPTAVIPAAGVVTYGPTHTLNDVAAAPGGSITYDSGVANVLTLSTDATSNALTIGFGTTIDPTNTSRTVDLLLTVTVNNRAFADALFLTNQVQSGERNTRLPNQANEANSNAIVQIQLNEPVITSIYKGVVASTQGGAAPTTGGLTFNPIGSNGFTGTLVGATNAAAIGALNLTTGTLPDAGDTVRYALVAQNTGRADAFDVTVQDTIRGSYVNNYATASAFAAATNFRVYDGAGNLLTAGADYTLSWDNGTKTFTVELIDTATQGRLNQGINPTAAGSPATTNGSNAIVVLYDLTVDTDAQAGSTVNNTASLIKYTGTNGATGSGTNFATQPLTESADVTFRQPVFTKTLVGTELNVTGNSNTQAVIGELATYTLTIVVPEGTTSLASIVDTLDAGLAFVRITSVSATSGVSASLPTVGTAPANTTIGGSGSSLTFNLGTITNTNVANGATETITITYEAVVLNTNTLPSSPGNQAASQLNNSATFAHSWTNDGVATPATGSATVTQSAANVTVVEPALTINNQVSRDNTTYTDALTGVDAGDEIFYRIQITNAANAPTAFDALLSDTLPAVLSGAAVFSVSGGGFSTSDFTITGGVLQNASAGGIDIPAGVTVTVVVRGTLAYSVTPNLTVNNTASVTWSSLDGAPGTRSIFNASATERNGAGGAGTDAAVLNNYSASDATALTVTTIANTKTVVATSENFTTTVSGVERVAIGEIVRYRLVVTLPEGTSPNLQIADTMPSGMVFLNDGTVMVGFFSAGGSITATNVPAVAGLNMAASTSQPTIVLSDAAISTSATANSDEYNAGTAVRFKLGDVVNSSSTAGAEVIVIEFNALVLNTFNTGNQSGSTLTNTMSTSVNGANVGNNATASVVVAEGNLTVSSVASTAGPVDAGDTFTYTITITNNATGNNATSVFDIRLQDALDRITASNPGAELEYLSFSAVMPTGTIALTDASSTTTDVLDVTFNRLNAGASIVVTVNVQVKTGAIAGSEIENKAVVTYTSLPGSTGTETPAIGATYGTADVDLNPGTDSVLANADVNNGSIILGASASERTGADSEATADNNTPPSVSSVRNNYAVAAVNTAGLVVNAPSLDKQFQGGSLTADDTNVASSTGGDVVIGETVTYDIRVTLPEGVTNQFRVLENIPAGLRIDAYQIITDGSTPLATTAFSGAFGSTPTLGAPTTGPGTLTLNFGNVTLPADNNAANNSFVIRVTGTVLNTLGNQAGVTIANTAQLIFNDPDGAGNVGPAADRTLTDSNTANDPVVTVREATLTVTKSKADGSPLDAGASIDYTITITNTSGQAAYDVTLSDALNQYLSSATGFIGVIANSSVSATGGATASANAFEIVDMGGGNYVLRTAAGANVDVPVGGQIQITYRTTITASVPPGAAITNVANTRWSSLDGGLNGSDAGSVNERTGSGIVDPAPAVLNQGTSTVLNDYALSSSVVSTAVNNVVVAKTIVTTSLGGADGVATPGELVTYRITVTLPEGVTPDLQIRDAIPAGMAYVPGTLFLDTTGYAGSVSAPTASPQTGAVYVSGTDILFDFAAITTGADNNITNNTFTFTYQGVVLEVAGNIGLSGTQTTLTNTATHNNGGADPTFGFGGGAASIVVVEPQLTVSNTLAITGPRDAGAPVTYTITVAPSALSTSGAYEVSIADLLPAEFGSLALVSAIISDGATSTSVAGNFSVAGNSLSTTTPLTLLLNTNGASDQALTITLSGVLTSQVNPGETVTTSTALTYTSYPGDRTAPAFNPNPDVTTDRERTYTASDTESFTAPTATFAKSLFATDQGFTTGSNLAIGEQVTYALLVTVPEGVTPDLTVLDRLPAGLQFISSSIVTTAVGSNGLLTGDFNGVVPAAAVTGGGSDGADVMFTFGAITSTGDNVTTNNSFLILVTARATNTLANQSGTILANDATFDISGDGQAVFTTPAVNVTVVEPRITAAKSVLTATTGLDAGDVVTYQIVLDNLVGNGATADAFDVNLADVLPAGLLITSIGTPMLAGGAVVDTALSGINTGTLNGTFDIPLGGSVTLTFTAQVQNTVAPGQALTSDLNVTFTSLNGGNANERTGADVADPETNTPPTNSAVLNNYAVGADATVTAANPFAVSKALIETSLGNDTSVAVVVGETLTYQITVSVMEGTTSSLSLIDVLPAGLVYVPGSVAITNANGMTINGFAASLAGNQLTITATSVLNPGGSNGTVNNSGVAETDSFTITYQAQVANVVGNQSGTSLTNNVSGSAVGVPSDNNNQITVTVREPVLTLTKTTTTAGTDAGDNVVYTLVLTNTGNATAYDVSIQDTLDAALQLAVPGAALAITAGPGYATLNQTGNTAAAVSSILNQLNAGDSVTITISAQVRAGATPGDTISNSASITYTSLPGTQTGERTGAGGVNDYTASATSANFVLATPTIDKLTPSDTTYSIGETVTYDILVTLPEGVTNDLVITDNLPAGLIYANVQIITSAAASGGLLTSDFAGTVGSPTVGNPSGNTRTFGFGSVTAAADNVAGNNTFVVRVTAQVANIAGNQGAGSPDAATTFSNTATLQYTDGTTGTATVTDPTAPGAITVIEPVLAIDKTITTPTTNVDAGDTVTYQIVVNHTGASTADAFDLILSDDMPAGLTGITLVSAFIGGTDVTSSFAINGSSDLVTTGNVDLLQGQVLTILVSGTVSNAASPGSTIANAATITWTSVNGVLAGERTGAGGIDDYTATDLAPTITVGGAFNVTKTLVNTSLGSDASADVVVGETLTYQIAVTVAEGTLSNLSLVDLLPIIGGANGLTYVPGSATISNANGMTINGFSAVYNAGTNQLTLTASSVVNPGGSNGTGNSGATLETDTFFITYQVQVANVSGNQSPVTLTNNISGTATNVPPDNNNQVTVTVREPVLTLTKTTTTPGADAGDNVVYTLVITNTGDATAYDVSIQDTLDAALQLAAPGAALAITTGPGYATLNQAGNTAAAVSSILNQLNAGDSVTITISAQVRAGATPGDTISNSASITYTSLPGTQTGERTGAGGVNDYTASASSANFVLATPTIDKLTPSDTTYSIGETITYDILVTLPEGVTDGLIITDNLPAGLVYTGFEIITSAAASGGLLSGDFAGTVGSPIVSNPTGNTRTFGFGSVTAAADNVTGNNTFVLRVTARVDNTLANQGAGSPGAATTFANTATLQYTNGTTGTATVTDPSAPGAVTVVEPVLTFDKTIAATSTGSTTDLDAGDTVTYQITFTNTGSAAAHDVLLSDLLPGGLLITSINAVTLAGGATIDAALAGVGSAALAGEFTVPVGGSVTITYVATVQNTITPGSSFTNAAEITWSSIDGANANERTGATGTQGDGSLNDYSLEDSVTISTSSVSSFSKSLFSTDQAFTTGANVAIGENVVFALRITLPEGTTPDLSVIDRLPAGLQYVSSAIVTSAAASNGLLLADFNGSISSPTITGGLSDGSDVSYTFDAITAAGDNSTDSNSFLILVTARVTNTLGNQSGTLLANDATFDISSDSQPLFTSSVVETTVVEPRVTVSKVITTATTGIDAGDLVTYQITLDNLGANGATADAFDVNLSDLLPGGLLITSIGVPTLTGGTSIDAALGGLGTGNLTGSFDLPLGASVTFTYTAQVAGTVAPGQILTSELDVTFGSLNGVNANERTGADVADPDDNTPPANDAILNNYAVGADTTITAVNPFAVTKTLANTTLGNDASADVVVGETLTYQLAISVMEGTTSSLSITDLLPAGVNYIPGSLTISNANGVTINGLAVTLIGNQLNITATSVVNPGGSNGSTNDPGLSETDTFFITYQVQVANVVGNQDGVTLTNTATATATGVLPDSDNQVTVTVREPVLSLDKTTTVTGSDAGDNVVYTLVITNNGSAAAYDINVLDTLDLALELVAPGTALSIASGPGYATLDQSGNTAALVNSLLNQLNAGDSITLTINAQVRAGAVAGDTISNTASIAYTSLPGTQTGERTGANGAGGLNDYAASDTSADFVLATPTIDKLTPSDTTYSIGETVTYDILVTLPEGVTNDLVITDNLPAGLVYTGFEIITSVALSGGLLSGDFAGTVGAPTVGNPSGNTRTFGFGSVTAAADNVSSNNTFVLRVTAQVANIAGNQGAGSPGAATTFSNTATLQYTNGTTGTATVTDPTAPGAVTVVEPVLAIDKTITTPTTNVDAGDTVTYQIVVNHTGASTADAFDLILSDDMPAGLTGITLVSAFIGATDVTSSFAINSAGDLVTTGNVDLLQGQVLTILVSGTVSNAGSPGSTIANAATVTWTSVNGVLAGERTGAGGVDDYTATDLAPTITIGGAFDVTKTLVNTSLGSDASADVVVGETLTYQIAVTVAEGTLNNLSLVDLLPIIGGANGLTYVTGSATISNANGMTINGFSAVYNAGTNQLTLTASSVVNPGGSNGTGNSGATLETDTFFITYQVQVANVSGNQSPVTLTNNISGTATNVPPDNNNQVTVTVREPVLTLTKTTTTAGTDGGDSVVYTLVITNTGDATAYDVSIQDTLDAALQLAAPGAALAITTGPGYATLNQAGNTAAAVSSLLNQLNAGDSVTITISAQVRAGATPGDTISNSASITYTSLPGTQTGERTGADGAGGLNDYTASATSEDFVLATPTIDKLTPSETTYSIGETVTYDILVTLPEGVTDGLIITDNLPVGLVYTGFEIVTSAAASGGLLSSDFAGAVGSPAVGNPSGNTRTFGFGSVTTTADNITGNNTFVLRITARVDNTFANQGAGSPGAATSFANTATLQYTNGTTGTAIVTDPTTPEAIEVVEPVMNLDKTAISDTTDIDAGDTVQFQIVFGNTGSATAHDVVLADLLPPGMLITSIDSVIISGGAAISSAVSGTGTGSLSGEFTVPVGGQVTIVYTVTLQSTVAPGATLVNTASINWSSIDGANPNERTGADGLQGSSTLNDYALADSETVTTESSAAFVKNLVATSDPATPGANVGIGETATFSLAATLQQGVTDLVTFTDSLPTGVGYVNGSAVFRVITPGATAVGAISGTVYTEGAAIAASDLVYNPVTGALIFSFSNVVIPATGAAGVGTFAVEYTAVVQDVPTNVSGVTLTNSAAALVDLNNDGDTSDAGETSATSAQTLTIVEPFLQVAKTSNDADGIVTAGQTVTYTLTLTNSGTATAFDVLLRDVIPAGLVYVPGSATFTGGIAPDAGTLTISAATLTAQFSALAVGESATITFQAVVQSTGSLENNVRVFYDSLIGDEPTQSVIDLTPDNTPDRDYGATGGFDGPVEAPGADTDPAQATSTVTLGTGAIGDRLWFDRNGNGLQEGSEPGLTGVTVRLTGFNPDGSTYTLTAITGINGAYQFTSLAPTTGADTYTVTVDVTTLPAGATPTYDLDGAGTANTVSGLTLANGQSRTELDFGYNGVGRIGDTVWLDANGDGLRNGQEPGIANVTLNLIWDENGNNAIDAGEAILGTATTDLTGAYSFGNLIAGNYLVQITDTLGILTGASQTYDLDGLASANIAAASLTGGALVRTDVDFGYRGAASISGRSYHDQLKNGNFDGADTGIGGVQIELIWDQNNDGIDATDPILVATTAADGSYTFGNLLAGAYFIRETQPTGFGQGTENGSDNVPVTLPSASTATSDVDFGNTTGSIAGRVFVDANNNGVDDGEAGIANAEVTLTWSGADGVFGTGDDRNIVAVTDGNGNYVFDYANTAGLLDGYGDTNRGLLATGAYRLTQAQPAGYLDGADIAGNASISAGGVDVGAYPGLGGRGADRIGVPGNEIRIAAGEDAAGYKFGEILPASISGHVFIDANGDGVKQKREAGIAGVTLHLTGIDDLGNTVDLEVKTNGRGEFRFDALRPGTYEMREIQPTTYLDGRDTVGTAGGTRPRNDTVTGIVLTAGQQATDYAFGERLRPVVVTPPVVVIPPAEETPEPEPTLSFAFDGFNNFNPYSFFNEPEREVFPSLSPIDVYRPAILPLMPVYSGTANPGATMVIDLYNTNGDRVGTQTVTADAGGNWLATFPTTVLRDYPATLVITQSNIGAFGEITGANLRTYYSPTINAGEFSYATESSLRLIGDGSAPLLGGLVVRNPISLGSVKYSEEFLAGPGSPAGR